MRALVVVALVLTACAPAQAPERYRCGPGTCWVGQACVLDQAGKYWCEYPRDPGNTEWIELRRGGSR